MGASMTVKEIDFVKLSPTQNMTLLVRTEHPVGEYPDIATAIMSVGHVHAEQVGFIREPTLPGVDAHLHMSADEFCGNGCMALAALVASKQGLRSDGQTDIVLEASGAQEPIRCRVERRYPDYYCQLPMPLPSRVEPYLVEAQDAGRSALVLYENSVHVVIETERLDQETKDRAEVLAKQLEKTWSVPLIGVMLYSPGRKQLAPLISIPSLGCMIWEKSCGSGMASLGAYLAMKAGGSVMASITQPGGTMSVEAQYVQGVLKDLQVAGTVRIVAEGRAYVHA